MKDKAAVGADLYVEDSASNIQDLRAAGKDVIAFITPQNRAAGLDEPCAENWAQVEALVTRHIALWREARRTPPPPSIAGH
jgi:beta-phosphoglucomutase-like phosphatase (HAD superfamily)